ncbi:hypothetical protein DICVIV_08533 [Dictyocaulus viviparus]|uniref:Uncharacterized protein n=1 Tax=Dictyocaulus viviparus TaxID=29172 RepID=A0A0D8XNN5_DICVI|nr:hypothetical protein DICVIV_08533 [Dictyocaulus viviparus]
MFVCGIISEQGLTYETCWKDRFVVRGHDVHVAPSTIRRQGPFRPYLLFSLLTERWTEINDPVMPKEVSRCCGMLHVRTLAFIIAIFEIMFLIYQSIVATFFVFSTTSSHHLSAIVYSLAVIIACVAVALLLLGILFHIPVLLIPHLLMQVLFTLTLIGMALCAAYALFVGTSIQVRFTISGDRREQFVEDVVSTSKIKLSVVSNFLTGVLVSFIIGYLVSALAIIWCFNVMMDCYRWLGLHSTKKSRTDEQKEVPIVRTNAKTVAIIHTTDF